jgi:DNA-binding SARP family transcriptional activator
VTDGIWRFGVLGPLVIERNGEPVPLASRRQRELLALLLMAAGVPRSRDQLINELWGEHPPQTAVSAIHVHLSKLRTLLDGLLALEPAGYLLVAEGFELDTQQLDTLLEQARDIPERAQALLNEALGLFRGEPLCDVMTDGSVSQWAQALQEKRLQANLTAIDIELEAGRAAGVLTVLEGLVAEHPFEERVWGQLILAVCRRARARTWRAAGAAPAPCSRTRSSIACAGSRVTSIYTSRSDERPIQCAAAREPPGRTRPRAGHPIRTSR